jgi:hypothetical protein
MIIERFKNKDGVPGAYRPTPAGTDSNDWPTLRRTAWP